METMYQIVKTILALLFCVEQLFAPKIAGGDFSPSDPAEQGDEAKYVQITADDEGFDTWQPVKDRGG